MSDLDTTALDGQACYLCGDDASGIGDVSGHPMWTCPTCYTEQIFECEDCRHDFLMQHGHRLYGSASLYCPSCAALHPKVIEGRESAARGDVGRDDFEQVRR